ncbi:serine/threonine protein kinase [Stackebrandtia soli]|uniref:serine/threonine protein kinase n=1 Tax=Stackebrandtia soli TaxID=1892856 RepID=UPI0039EA0D74
MRTISTAGAVQLTRLLHRDSVANVYAGYLAGAGTPVVATVAHSRIDGSRREVFLDWAARLTHLSAHPHIAPIVAIGLTEHARPYIAVHATRTTLADELREGGPPPAGQVRALGVALADTLATIHSTGLIHGALQPATVLSGTGRKLLVAGFDATAPVLAHVLPVSAYTAPEHLEASQAGTMCASPAADVYDLATLLYAALGGRLPWSTSQRADVADPLLRAAPVSDIPGINTTLTDVLAQAMRVDPHERPDAAGLRDLLTAVDLDDEPAPGDRPRAVSADLVPRSGPRPTPFPGGADIAVTAPEKKRTLRRWHPAATVVTALMLGISAIGGAGLATFFATSADAETWCPQAEDIDEAIADEFEDARVTGHRCENGYVIVSIIPADAEPDAADREVLLTIDDGRLTHADECAAAVPTAIRGTFDCD